MNELHPLMKALNEAHRTLGPVMMTIAEGEAVMREIIDLRIRVANSVRPDPHPWFA